MRATERDAEVCEACGQALRPHEPTRRDWAPLRGIVSTFLSTQTVADTHGAIGARELYHAWLIWSAAAGRDEIGEVIFSQEMARFEEIKKVRRNRGMVYLGISMSLP